MVSGTNFYFLQHSSAIYKALQINNLLNASFSPKLQTSLRQELSFFCLPQPPHPVETSKK